LADVLSDAVAQVAALLRAEVFAAPLAGLSFTPGGRVHAYPPASVTAPAVWLEAAGGAARYDDSYWATTIDVVTVGDGANDAGWELLYELTDRVINLLSARSWLGAPAPDCRLVGCRSRPVDVGGPTLRGFETTVEMYVPRPTMCTDNLTLATTGGLRG
jgi:hypothetical protein